MPATPGSSPFQACIDEALRSCSPMLNEALAASRQALQRQADQSVLPAERAEIMEVLGHLIRSQAVVQDAFPRMLREEILQAIDGGSRSGGLSFGSLELMDSDQVQENVETARAQQAAASAVEGELGQLNALISSAQGLPRVQLDRNPLRPEIYMKSLRRAMAQTQAPAKARMRWMQVFGESMGPHLAKVYDHLCDLLRSQGVGVATFRVITQPSTSAPQRAAEAAGGGAPVGTATGVRPAAAAPRAAFGFDVEAQAPVAPAAMSNRRPEFESTRPGETEASAQAAAAGASASPDMLDLPPILLDENGAAVAFTPASPTDGKLLTLARLHELLAGQVNEPAAAPGGQSAAATPRADFQMTMPAAFEALEEMGEAEEMVQRVAFKNFQIDDGSGQSAAAPAVQASNTAQALALEVVQVMLEQLTSDSRLLSPVRGLIDNMRPALMRLVVADPRFFSDKQHPARVLLDRIAQGSLAWNDEDDAGFRAYLTAAQMASTIVVESKLEGADPFVFALETFDDALGDLQRREQRKRESAARAMSHLAERQRLAEEIGGELVKRARQAGVPRSIALFLRGPWAHVIAQARLMGQTRGREPERYEEVVTDLLWSTKVSAAMTQTERLARVAPGLTARLREGLEFIRYAPHKLEQFLKDLAAIHQAALLAAASGRSPDSAPQLLPDDSKLHDGMWMEESGLMTLDFEDTAPPAEMPSFENTAPPTQVAPLFENTMPHEWTAEDEAAGVTSAGSLGSALVPGTWLEVFADGRWLRWRCEGGEADGSSYRFTDANGAHASLTGAQLGRLHARGDLRVVAAQGMVDGALDAVAEIALRNSASNSG